MRAPIALALLFLGVSCALDGPIGCDQYAVAGINVLFEDSVTHATSVFRNVWVRASGVDFRSLGYRDSTFKDSIFDGLVKTPYSIGLVWERPGRFRVTATVDGYAPWHGFVTVRMEDKCHVKGEVITARLKRE